MEDLLKDRIDQLIASEVPAVDRDVFQAVDSLSNKLNNGELFNVGNSCLDQIRSVRAFALSKYHEIKSKLNRMILQVTGQANSVKDMQQLRQKEKELEEEKTKLQNIITEKSLILSKKNTASKYQLYQLFNDSSKTRPASDVNSPSEKNDSPQFNNVIQAVCKTQNDYKKKFWRFTILGIFLTLVFAATDYYLLNSVFLASNMSVRTAIRSAIISAIALDAPPYLLGWVITKKNDDARIWHIRNEPNDPGQKKSQRTFLVVFVFLLLTIILIISAYLMLRFLLFLGGGDINVSLRAFFESGFPGLFSNHQSVQFNASDIIQMFIPIITSASAFAISILLSAPKSDEIEKTILVIYDELDRCVVQCEREMIDHNSKINFLQDEIKELSKEVYIYFTGAKNGALPNREDDKFLLDIITSSKRLHLAEILPQYQVAAGQLRRLAENKLREINLQIAPYTKISPDVMRLCIDDKEAELLDEIWVPGQQPQKEETENVMNQISEFTRLLS